MAKKDDKPKSKKEKPKQNGSNLGTLFMAFFPFLLLISSVVMINFVSKFESVAFSLPSPPKFEGPLAVNTRLQNAEFLIKDQGQGPESLLVEGDFIYTVPEDGRLLKLNKNGKILKEVILVNDKDCKTRESRTKHIQKCGRPLGMRRLNKDLIIFADAYLGIVTVDVEKGKINIILPGNTIVDGKPIKFADDLDILDENIVFFSDASTKWNYHVCPYDHIEGNPNGRIIQLNIKTKEVKVLLDGLYFPNGVQLFPDKQSVLTTESWRSQITRIYIAGPKKGQHELFMTNLPGVPDNLRLNSKGNFYVAIAYTRHPDKFYLWDFLAPYPWVRNFIMQVIPESYIGLFHHKTLIKYGLVIEVDTNGKIVSSLHDPTGGVYEISQLEEDDTHFYVASFHQPFIAKVRK